jgi:hypothetical protein
MKKYNPIIISLIVLILIRCVEEPEPRAQEYPIFQTSVEEIDDSGVILTIDVLNRGSGVIKQFGFLLGEESSTDFKTNRNISFVDELSDTFSTRIATNLSPDVRYVARGYIILEADTVFGNAADFTSLGSATPIITDFSPTSGIDGDTITLTGTNFSTSRNDVSISFGENSASIVSTTIEEIKAIVPLGAISGNTTISLTVFDDDVSIEGFVVNSPTIESISPDAGFDGTEVTLVGNFSKVKTYNKVLFNGINAYITEQNSTQIKAVSPRTSLVGDVNVVVETNGKISNSISYYTIGPVIESVSPLEGQYGDIITIEGVEFSSTTQSNIVKIGDTQVQVLSSSSSKLEISVPNITYGSREISLKVGNKVATYGDLFTVNSSWQDGLLFTQEVRLQGESFNVGDKGYLLLGDYCHNGTGRNASREVWEYDPVAVQWKRKNDFPSDGRWGTVGFVIDEYVYIGGGWANVNGYTNGPYNDFYRYDPINDSWTQLADLPSPAANSLSFSVGGKGYIGSGRIEDFYEYDASSDEWNRISNPNVGCCSILETGYNTGFSYENKGYALISNQLWELDPTDKSWTKKAIYPGGNRFGPFAFILEGNAYVGSGSGKKPIYKYDFNSDSWSQIESLDAFKTGGAFSFVINSKAYVVSEEDDCLGSMRMYEFAID